jgi:CubicO group peptidase (beta-lactamase class C family)
MKRQDSYTRSSRYADEFQVHKSEATRPMSASRTVPGNANVTRYKVELQPLLEDVIRKQCVPGFTIVVLERLRVAYSYSVGWTDSENRKPITNRSLFHMASVTKPFTATAIMQLVERRKIDLDAPAARYLPYFKVRGTDKDVVTVRQMLTHTSGLPDVTDYRWGDPHDDEGALERNIRALGDLQLRFKPGTAFLYSNIGYDMLGDLVSKTSGRTYDDYVCDEILTPLGMRDSTLLFRKVNRRRMVAGNVLGPEGDPMGSTVYPYNRAHSPSSGLISNAMDMTRWALANLNRGRLRGRRILSPETYDAMWKAERELGEVENCLGTSVGLGWFLKSYRGNLVITHSGGDTGFLSDLAMVPERGIAVLWMSNCDWIDSGPLNGPITYAALDVASGVRPQPIRVMRNLAKTLHQTFRAEGIDAALRQYETLKTLKPDSFEFGEAQLGAFGSRLLSEGHTKDAIRVLQLNVRTNPSSADAYNRLAKANELDGNSAVAIAQYKKALELNPALTHSIRALRTLEAR